MMANYAFAYDVAYLAISTAARAAMIIGLILLVFFLVAYLLVDREKAFPFVKLSRSGFEIGFKPFQKDDGHGEDR